MNYGGYTHTNYYEQYVDEFVKLVNNVAFIQCN